MNTIDEAIIDLKAGKMIVVMDDEDRENEGDLICSAELTTPDMVNFMVSKGRGLICVPLSEERAKALDLGFMENDNSALHGTNFTVSVDYVHGTTTGISTADRAATIRAIADENTKAEDLGRPGHIFPLIALNGGVLRRAGHTEGTVDLMGYAGLQPCGVLCEILNDDGSMARRPQLEVFAKEYDLKMITIKDLIAYRLKAENFVKCVSTAKLPTDSGDFTVKIFLSSLDNKEHIALVKGTWEKDEVIPVRVHSECITGDVFGSLRCDCGDQLKASMQYVSDYGKGVVLYMRQEGRGIGLANKVKAYHLQDEGMDTVEANIELGFKPDAREYGVGAQILAHLGVCKMKLLTNNPQKRVGIVSYGLEVVEMIPIEIPANEINRHYLLTKKNKLGHLFHNLDE